MPSTSIATSHRNSCSVVFGMMTQIVCAEAENFESMRNVLVHRIVLDKAGRDDGRDSWRERERAQKRIKRQNNVFVISNGRMVSLNRVARVLLARAHITIGRSVGQYEEQAEIFSDRSWAEKKEKKNQNNDGRAKAPTNEKRKNRSKFRTKVDTTTCSVRGGRGFCLIFIVADVSEYPLVARPLHLAHSSSSSSSSFRKFETLGIQNDDEKFSLFVLFDRLDRFGCMVIAIRQIAFVGFQQKPFRIGTRSHTCSVQLAHTRARNEFRVFFFHSSIISSACILSVSFGHTRPKHRGKRCAVPTPCSAIAFFSSGSSHTILPGCTSGPTHCVCVRACSMVWRGAERRKEGQKSVVPSLSAALWGRIRSLEMFAFFVFFLFLFTAIIRCSLACVSDDDDDDAHSFMYSRHHQTKTGSASCIYTNKDGSLPILHKWIPTRHQHMRAHKNGVQ